MMGVRRVRMMVVTAALIGAACSYPPVEIASDRCDGGECTSGADADGPDDVDAPPDAPPDADVPRPPCDMTGVWIVEEHTWFSSLGADQHRTRWYYQRISQVGDRFVVDDYLDCGFLMTGTTTVTLSSQVLARLVTEQVSGLGRQGTSRLLDGPCQFALDVAYEILGANRATFLSDVWRVGDPALPLNQFPPLPDGPPGMEDWDLDGNPGVTLESGLGRQYVAQRSWSAYSGIREANSSEFGDGAEVLVRWDQQEVFADETPPILRLVRTPRGDGWVRYRRATIERREPLTTCRDVQQAWREPAVTASSPSPSPDPGSAGAGGVPVVVQGPF